MRNRQIPQERVLAGAKEGNGIFDNETAKRERVEFLLVYGDASQAALAELFLLLQSNNCLENVMTIITLGIVKHDRNLGFLTFLRHLHVAAAMSGPAIHASR